MKSERGCGISTRNQRLSALAAFSIYAQNRDFRSAAVFRNSVVKVPKKKAPRAGRNPFTREEVKLLFTLPNAHTEAGKRDKVLLRFMYASGMRAQEICDLTVGDIQFYTDRAGINVHGKEFESKLIPKYQRDISGIEEKVISLYARGMSTRDIHDQLQDLYGIELSADMVSNSSVADVYALLKDRFKDILQELMEAELDATFN